MNENRKTDRRCGRFRRGAAGALAAALLLGAWVAPLRAVQAAELKQPVYAYGESLTPEEKDTTAKLLGVSDGAKEMVVKIDELNGLLHDNYPYHQVYSSVYLEPMETKQGVEVEIKTPDTITEITPLQYRNAAITAGAINLRIRVASVKAVDGSGALGGVYKAFLESGEALPTVNVEVAQKELEVTAEINQANQGKEGYSNEALNAALAEMKAEIQKIKEETGKVTSENITNVVQNIINNYQLNLSLTDEQVKQLQDFLQKFSEIEFTSEQKKALADFGKTVLEQGGKLLEHVKSSWEGLSPEVKSGIGGFFASLWDGIVSFFQGLFGGN